MPASLFSSSGQRLDDAGGFPFAGAGALPQRDSMKTTTSSTTAAAAMIMGFLFFSRDD
jgi:hypothetical protein